MQHSADHLARYISGQEDFLRDEQLSHYVTTNHPCERCQRPCSGKYRHCWRCAQYLRTKARLASECS